MLPDFIHGGAQKAASTWIYHALKEHPEICMPDNEPVNYFDVHYNRGEEWYEAQFGECEENKLIGDESPGYIKHPLAPARASQIIPDAKIIFCLRNPMNRAYSQWWNAEQYWTDGKFERATRHHATNDVFITPGLYNYHISNWEKHYPKENIKITFFDDFKNDNESFIKDIYEFVGADSGYTPSIIGEKIQAGENKIESKSIKNKRKKLDAALASGGKKLFPDSISEPILRPLYRSSKATLGSIYTPLVQNLSLLQRGKYTRGDMDPEIRKELEEIYHEDVQMLEERVDRDLSHWFKYK